MTEIQLGKGRHNAGIVDTTHFKGGIKKEQLENEQQKAIFDMVDTDKNGVLDENEIQKFKEQLETTAGNEKLSKREAGRLLKQNNLKNINKKEVFQFVNQLAQNSENIEQSQVLEENGQKTIIITYKDGSQETINPDKTTQIATTDLETKAVTTKFYNENKALTQESVVQQNGDSEVTTFADNQPQQKTITLADGTKTTVIDYKDGKEISSTVTEGATTSTFEYIDGKPRIIKKVVDKGNGGKAESTYVYNENGSVTETTEEPNKKTVTILVDGKPQEITITEGNKSTHQAYTNEGMIETINDPDNKTEVLTKFNSDGKRLAQGKVVDGKQYEVAYDGQGNTTGIVVQNGESIDALAKKFGCSKEDIINANKELLNGKKYFNVGDTIKIPREVDADYKGLQGRKTSEEAKAEYARDAQKRAEAEAIRKAENAQLKALGLQNRKDAGKTWTKDGKKYTIVGNAAYNRKIVKDSKGKIHVFANGGDGVELKLDYVGSDIANVRAGKTRIVKNGTAYYVEGQRKDDKHGRYNISDWHGNQYTLSGGKKAGEFSDRTILRSSYIKASDANDAGHGTRTYLNDGSTSVTVNGKTYYFDKNGNSVDGNKKSTQIANAIKADLDKAANDKTLGFIPDTDETLLAKANAGITDRVILAKINARYAAEGYKPNSEYRTAYEAFQGTELQRNEVYANNAALVKNGAIQDQARRNEILYTNVIQYGNKSENLHAGLDAISTREDFNQLNTYANRANTKRGYQAQFKNQSALNTFIYGQTGGNADKIKSANDALIDPNEDFLTQEEITQTRAEEGIYFLQKAKSRTFAKGWQADDLEKALSSNNGDIYRKMDELLAEKHEAPIGELDFLDYDQKSRLVSAGYGNFSNDELANLALENLKWKKRAISTQNSIQNEINSSVTGNSGLTQNGRLGDAGQSEGQATSNIYALLNTKEAYDKFMKLAEKDPELKSLANSIDKSKLRFTTTTSNLSQDQINTNKSKLEQLKTQMAMAERYANNTFASEGVKKSSINAVREAMGLGITRSQLNTILRNAGYNINALELAAEGKLTDGNGKVISYDDLEKIIKANIKNTEDATQTYQQHQTYGEIATDITGAIVTMPLAGGAIGTAAKGLKYAKTATALGTGLTMGAETYGMDRLDQTTSVSGDTMQARQASRDKSVMVAVTTAAGMRIGMSTSALDKNIAQRVLGASIDITTDVGVASGVEYSQTGEVSEEGLITNLAFSAVGNVVGHSMGKGKKPAPTPEAHPKTTLDVATSDGTRMPGGKLGAPKFEQVKLQTQNEIPTATPQRTAQIHQEAHQLQGQSRPQGREIKHIVEDGVGYLEIGKKRIPLDTATPEQLQAAKKSVQQWTTSSRDKQAILNEIDNQLYARMTKNKPTSTRASETVDNINTQMQRNAGEILSGEKGGIGSHDAATLRDHITNNLNTVEELESFIGSLKNKVGTDSNGNMHVYQVEGQDHAASLMKQAQTKINNIKAHNAELNTVTGQLDSAIAANKGLSGEELATARAFMDKSNSVSELETLIAKMNGSKSIKKSNAARKLISDMQAKVDILKAKQAATSSAQTSAPVPKARTSKVEEIATQPQKPTPVKPQEKPPVATISDVEIISVEKPTPKAGTSKVEAETGVSSVTNNSKYNNPRLNKYKTNKNKPLINHEQFYQDNAELFKGTKRSYGTVWQQYTPADQHHGAWKMHMYSVDEHDWQQMAETLIPYLKEHGIEWKTFNPDYSASYLNNSKQRGKAFTIYPRDNAHMKQIATDLDYIIRNNNLNTTNSNIIGDRAMGSTGRLFYRYEFNSGKLQNEILDLSNPTDVAKYYQQDAFGRQIGGYYDANRGEGRYLANDMTPADDPWLNFDPANEHNLK